MRASTLLAVTGLLCGVPAVAAGPSPSVAEARRLIDDLEVESALKVLDAADKVEGNDRATVLEILTLQGIAWGTLGKDAKTRDAFRKLLLLSPQATLPKDLPPRVRTPFFEAKQWASENPLTVRPGVDLGDGLVRSVKVTVDKDVLRLARAVRFHLDPEGAPQTAEVPLVAGVAQVAVGKTSVAWWAEVLNERKGVVLEVGSEKSPQREWTVAPVAAPVAVLQERAVPGGWRRPTGIVLLGAGGVAAGVGVFLGVQANDARAKVTGAPRDALGRVTTLTQRDAATLETNARTQATVANVLFSVGGALGAAGVVLVVLGPSSEPSVALAPSPGGVVVTGAF